METTEIIITGGRLYREKVNREEIECTDEIIKSLSKSEFRKTNLVMEMPGPVPVGLTITGQGDYWTVPIRKLPLKAPFKTIDGVFFPQFSATHEPVLPLEWEVPEDMRLALVILTEAGDRVVSIKNQWLLALDSEKRCYRLPMGNIYEDGRLCIGDMKPHHASAQKCIEAELEQFARSQWNGDLDSSAEQTKALFRFKPVNAKDGKFEQQPPLARWQDLSKKISPSILNFIL